MSLVSEPAAAVPVSTPLMDNTGSMGIYRNRRRRFEEPVRCLGTTITCIDIVWFVVILIILWPILKMNLSL